MKPPESERPPEEEAPQPIAAAADEASGDRRRDSSRRLGPAVRHEGDPGDAPPPVVNAEAAHDHPAATARSSVIELDPVRGAYLSVERPEPVLGQPWRMEQVVGRYGLFSVTSIVLEDVALGRGLMADGARLERRLPGSGRAVGHVHERGRPQHGRERRQGDLERDRERGRPRLGRAQDPGPRRRLAAATTTSSPRPP